jgi:hypothetical protein
LVGQEKLIEFAPPVIATDRGAPKAEALSVRLITIAAPDGAFPSRVTVPVVEFPPTTRLGLKPTDMSLGA